MTGDSPYPKSQEYSQVTNRPDGLTTGEALTWLRNIGRLVSPASIAYPIIITWINLQQPERIIRGDPWVWWYVGALAYFGLNAMVSSHEGEVVN